LKEYFSNQTTYLDIGPPVFLVNKNGTDFSDPAVQRQLFRQYDLFTQTPYIDKGSASFWLEEFVSWVYTSKASCNLSPELPPGDIPKERFVPLLKTFLGYSFHY
jgi:hypothetical protein